MWVNMPAVHTIVFKRHKTQAVRLAKAVALPEVITKIDIVAIDNTRIIPPAGGSWSQWFDSAGVLDDFMPLRDQPTDQQRESF